MLWSPLCLLVVFVIDGRNFGAAVSTEDGTCALQQNLSCTRALRPTFFIIGIGHSGTTTLADQLNAHPALSYGREKEHKWFPDAGSRREYRMEFEVPCGVQQTFDASPFYIFDVVDNDEMELFRNTVGHNAKLIVLFRDPVKWVNSIIQGRGPWADQVRLQQGIATPRRHHRHRVQRKAKYSWDCYVDYIEEWLKAYPRDNIFFLQSDDYFGDPRYWLSEILEFVGAQHYDFTAADLGDIDMGRRRASSLLSVRDRQAYWQSKHNQECRSRLDELLEANVSWSF